MNILGAKECLDTPEGQALLQGLMGIKAKLMGAAGGSGGPQEQQQSEAGGVAPTAVEDQGAVAVVQKGAGAGAERTPMD